MKKARVKVGGLWGVGGWGDVSQSRALGPRDAPAHTQTGREPKYPGNVTGEANPGREPGAGGVGGGGSERPPYRARRFRAKNGVLLEQRTPGQ